MTFFDQLTRIPPYLLLAVYGVFMCGYFFLDDYASHYRLLSSFLFFQDIFVFVGIGSLTNINEFSAVYSVFALFALAGLTLLLLLSYQAINSNPDRQKAALAPST